MNTSMNATAHPPLAAMHASPASAWWDIPRLAGRLLWRHWPALAFWFFAQRVAYDLLLDAAIKLAEHSVLLAWAAMALLILTQLVGSIAMFLTLRPSLPMLSDESVPVVRGSGPWTQSLAVALLPFFAYYAAWGLLENINRAFELRYKFSIWYEQQELIHNILQIKGWWIALLASWGLRHVSKRLAARSNRLIWPMLVTVCEAYWIYVGVAVIARGVARAKDWWHERAVYVAVTDWWQNPFVMPDWLPPIKRVVEPLWDVITTAAGGLVLPLIWLAITAIVYGLDLRRTQRIDAADARLRVVRRRYRTAHWTVRKLTDKASAGWTSKGVPVLNSLRLVLRAGLPALLTLCVGWQLLAFIDAWGWRLLDLALGPRDPAWQQVIGQPLATLVKPPVTLRPALFTDLLRVVLLAATFDRAIAGLPRAAKSGHAH